MNDMSLEEELLVELDAQIKSGQITVLPSSDWHFTALASAYSLIKNTWIDFEKCPDSICKAVDSQDTYVKSCLNFYNENRKKHKLTQKCFYMNECSLECALHMPVEMLTKQLGLFLEDLPHHHYILAEDLSFCMEFTSLGTMEFGFRPKDFSFS